MKIYRKAVEQYNRNPQNPNIPNNPDLQLGNLQLAQEAIKFFENVITDSEAVMSAIRTFEEHLGIGDTGIKTQVQEALNQAVMLTPAFNLLAQMNFVSSAENLLDPNQMANIRGIIKSNIDKIQAGEASVSVDGS